MNHKYSHWIYTYTYIYIHTHTYIYVYIGGADAVVLVPCNNSDNNQLWTFDKGPTTITSVTNVGKGQALAVSNTSLYGTQHTHANVWVGILV